LPKITSINERLVFNSRGDKTIEVDVISDNHYIGRACAPSGASVGIYEAQSFIDNNPKKTIEKFKTIKKYLPRSTKLIEIGSEFIKSLDSKGIN